MNQPSPKLRVVEQSPRDTLQRAALFLSADEKVWACEALRAAGFPLVEATTFRPDLSPLFPDAEEVLRRLDLDQGYRALVYDDAAALRCADLGLREVAVNFASSPRYEESIGRVHAEALASEVRAVHLLRERGIKTVASLSASCGDGRPDHAEGLARTLDAVEEAAPEEVTLVDTYSLAGPEVAVARLEEFRARFPGAALAVHFHDGGGRAVENTRACVRAGAEVVELALQLEGGEEGGHANADTAAALAALEEAGFETPEVDREALEAVRRRMSARARPLGSA